MSLVTLSSIQRWSDANTTKKSLSLDKDASILSWPAIMGDLKQLICLSSELQSYSSSPTTRLSSPTGSATASPYPLQGMFLMGSFVKGVGDTC